MPKTRAEKHLAEFLDESEWQESRKGNLWRKWQGITITIFEREDAYHWCISRAKDDVVFSQEGFADTVEAQAAAFGELDDA